MNFQNNLDEISTYCKSMHFMPTNQILTPCNVYVFGNLWGYGDIFEIIWYYFQLFAVLCLFYITNCLLNLKGDKYNNKKHNFLPIFGTPGVSSNSSFFQ